MSSESEDRRQRATRLPTLTGGGAALLFLANALSMPIAAQLSIETPWVSKSTVSNLPGSPIPPMAASPSGDLYTANLEGPVSITKKAGDASAGFGLIAKLGAGGSPGFILQLGGAGPAAAIAADAAGNVYVSGYAAASGLPTTPGAYHSAPSGDRTPYVCKLSGADGTPLFCTYVGDDQMNLVGMAIDSAGNTYLAAQRSASTMAATPGALSIGSRQVLVMKLDPKGSSLLYAAEFGGSGSEAPVGLAVDAAQNVYIAGQTSSPDLSGNTGSPIPPPQNGQTVPFVAKLNPQATQVLYAAYGRAAEYPISPAIAIDSAGEIHLVIGTFTGSLAQFLVRKYSSDGFHIVYETSFGFDQGIPFLMPLAIDEQNVATLVFGTSSIGLPVHSPTSTCPLPGQLNGYLIRLSPSGGILQSTYLSAPGELMPFAISAQSTGGYVAASIGAQLAVVRIAPASSSAATTPIGCYGSAATFDGGPLAPGEILSIFGDAIGPASPVNFQWNGQSAAAPLAGVTVTFDGVPAPLLYVESSQVNAIAPFELAGKSSSQMCLTYGAVSGCVKVKISGAAPGVFQYIGADGAPCSSAINQDGTLNTRANPAPVGSVVSVYVTGLGAMTPSPPDGTAAGLPLPSLNAQVTASFSNVDFHKTIPVTAKVVYAGPAPLEVAGMYQVNVQIPAGTGDILILSVQAADGSIYQTSAPLYVGQ